MAQEMANFCALGQVAERLNAPVLKFRARNWPKARKPQETVEKWPRISRRSRIVHRFALAHKPAQMKRAGTRLHPHPALTDDAKERTMAMSKLLDESDYPQDSYWERLNPQETGVVYFYGAHDRTDGTLELVKIGFSRDINGRLNSLSNLGPMKGKLLVTAPGGSERERYYHKLFAEHRTSHEWFRPHPDILAEIDRLKARQ
jgi:hypothetical protein